MFNPTLETRLIIADQEYTFSPHPVVPTLVWGQEGRHAIVYRLQSNGDAYALKVFRPAFRHPGLRDAAEALWSYHELPGMRVCKQSVIMHETHPDLVARHEDLEFAMLMPWIDGDTWFDFLHNCKSVTFDQSRALAESIAWALYALELNHLAHCDLSSGNVIVDPKLDRVHLVDVEDLYSPWLTPPPMLPAGSFGYQHRDVALSGQWGPLGDRFAGAVLLSEMLGWGHPEVRQSAWGESYFAPDELQRDGPRFRALLEVLEIYHPGFAESFAQAWLSDSLEGCPPLKTWYDLLDALPRDPVASWAPIGVEELGEEVSAAVAPVLSSRRAQVQARRPGRKGCRTVALIGMVLALCLCYAAFLLVEWSILNEVF